MVRWHFLIETVLKFDGIPSSDNIEVTTATDKGISPDLSSLKDTLYVVFLPNKVN